MLDPPPVMKFNLAKALRLAGCVLTLSLAAGCGNPCRDLASKICSCLPDDGTRAACNTRARQQESIYTVGKEDQQLCQQKLDSCDCTMLNTPEGRVNCGIAWILPP